MSAMKRLLEEYMQGILDFLFPDGMDKMSEADKDRWNERAYEAALKVKKEFEGKDVD